MLLAAQASNRDTAEGKIYSVAYFGGFAGHREARDSGISSIFWSSERHYKVNYGECH
jgi:hypothetical protein